ncbi:MAG TPA: glutaredoxin domain-containing protein [Chloroflexota bacterium]|nr:glutaredoxin domain-containing protein [Chloroflexota bacterium]
MKEFLSQHEIPYELRDVVSDAAARDEFLARGWLLPPVTVVDGMAVAGYQPERLLELLHLR